MPDGIGFPIAISDVGLPALTILRQVNPLPIRRKVIPEIVRLLVHVVIGWC
jgi:hypothetical protein